MVNKKSYRILVLNPGATSTKIAVFDNEMEIMKKALEHTSEELQGFKSIIEQYAFRLEKILEYLAKNNIGLETLSAVVGRGGLLKPLAGGTYEINNKMVMDLQEAKQGEHASNLGGVIAANIAKKLMIPSYIVDPVSVDEMESVARISGLPEFNRISLSHALNMKAVARKTADDMGKNYSDLNLIVVHLGTGISVAPHKKGRMIDINNAKDEGPFSVDRCGGLPVNQLIKLCYSGKYSYQELKDRLAKEGGIYAYLKTKDLREAEKRAKSGDKKADLVLSALTYQVSKEIGAMAAVLEGEVDRIVLSGGMAFSQRIIDDISKKVKFIAPLVIIPGEMEMDALALGALRVLQGEEEAKKYI